MYHPLNRSTSIRFPGQSYDLVLMTSFWPILAFLGMQLSPQGVVVYVFAGKGDWKRAHSLSSEKFLISPAVLCAVVLLVVI